MKNKIHNIKSKFKNIWNISAKILYAIVTKKIPIKIKLLFIIIPICNETIFFKFISYFY